MPVSFLDGDCDKFLLSKNLNALPPHFPRKSIDRLWKSQDPAQRRSVMFVKVNLASLIESI